MPPREGRGGFFGKVAKLATLLVAGATADEYLVEGPYGRDTVSLAKDSLSWRLREFNGETEISSKIVRDPAKYTSENSRLFGAVVRTIEAHTDGVSLHRDLFGKSSLAGDGFIASPSLSKMLLVDLKSPKDVLEALKNLGEAFDQIDKLAKDYLAEGSETVEKAKTRSSLIEAIEDFRQLPLADLIVAGTPIVEQLPKIGD